MSLETLLEAARYVEYRSEAKARGEEPHDYHTFSKLSSASKDGVYMSPPHPSRRQQTVSTSSSEDVRERRRSLAILSHRDLPHDHAGTGTREVHNKLEKNRRAHLKECFEALKKQLPNMDDRKTSNLSILRGAIRFIQALKRKEREYEHDMERLAREKIAFQQRLSTLKKDLASHLDSHMENYQQEHEEENETTTTASECGHLSDFEDSPPNEVSADTASASPSPSRSSTEGAAVPQQATQPPPSSTLVFSRPGSLASVQPTPKEGLTSFPTVDSQANDTSTQPTRVFSTGNLHTMAGIFAAPHGMQVITQPSGIKVITSPSSIVASPSHIPHGQIHVLAPSAVGTFGTTAKPFTADSLVQVNSSKKPHLVSPLALVHPSQSVIGVGNSAGKHMNSNISDVPSATLNLSQKAGKSASPQQNMILHVSKPHAQVIQASGIIAQGGPMGPTMALILQSSLLCLPLCAHFPTLLGSLFLRHSLLPTIHSSLWCHIQRSCPHCSSPPCPSSSSNSCSKCRHRPISSRSSSPSSSSACPMLSANRPMSGGSETWTNRIAAH